MIQVKIIPVEKVARVHGRSLLLSLLEKEKLLTRISVLNNVCFVTETKTWDEYWRVFNELDCDEINDQLHSLYAAWCGYIQSGFAYSQKQEYCFRYFSLLDRLLLISSENFNAQIRFSSLQTILGFECFKVTSTSSDNEIFGTGTTTVRNPNYLLAKLKIPNIPDDPRYLPVITVARARMPYLFKHYR